MITLRQDGTEASDDIGHKIELTDPDLEIASNIGLFLDVYTAGSSTCRIRIPRRI